MQLSQRVRGPLRKRFARSLRRTRAGLRSCSMAPKPEPYCAQAGPRGKESGSAAVLPRKLHVDDARPNVPEPARRDHGDVGRAVVVCKKARPISCHMPSIRNCAEGSTGTANRGSSGLGVVSPDLRADPCRTTRLGVSTMRAPQLPDGMNVFRIVQHMQPPALHEACTGRNKFTS